MHGKKWKRVRERAVSGPGEAMKYNPGCPVVIAAIDP